MISEYQRRDLKKMKQTSLSGGTKGTRLELGEDGFERRTRPSASCMKNSSYNMKYIFGHVCYAVLQISKCPKHVCTSVPQSNEGKKIF